MPVFFVFVILRFRCFVPPRCFVPRHLTRSNQVTSRARWPARTTTRASPSAPCSSSTPAGCAPSNRSPSHPAPPFRRLIDFDQGLGVLRRPRRALVLLHGRIVGRVRAACARPCARAPNVGWRSAATSLSPTSFRCTPLCSSSYVVALRLGITRSLGLSRRATARSLQRASAHCLHGLLRPRHAALDAGAPLRRLAVVSSSTRRRPQVFFVGFRVIETSDHLAMHGVFGFMLVRPPRRSTCCSDAM